MAKSKKKSLNLADLIAFACAVLAIVCAVLPFAVAKIEGFGIHTTTYYKGFDLFFGSESVKNVTGVGESAVTTKISCELVTGCLISFITVVLGLFATAATNFVGKKNRKFVALFAALLLVASAVLFALAPVFVNGDSNVAKIGIGAILSCAFAGVAGLVEIYLALKK